MTTKLCPYCAEEIQEAAVKCKHCGSWLTEPGKEEYLSSVANVRWRLVRPSQHRVVAGVCGGLARYLGLDPTVVRVVYAVTTFFTGIIPGTVFYLMLVLLIPSEAHLTA